MGQRRTALVLSLLTFCPPGPLLRTKVNVNSRMGIWSFGVTISIKGDFIFRPELIFR
jgi:hypothetical protein